MSGSTHLRVYGYHTIEPEDCKDSFSHISLCNHECCHIHTHIHTDVATSRYTPQYMEVDIIEDTNGEMMIYLFKTTYVSHSISHSSFEPLCKWNDIQTWIVSCKSSTSPTCPNLSTRCPNLFFWGDIRKFHYRHSNTIPLPCHYLFEEMMFTWTLQGMFWGTRN